MSTFKTGLYQHYSGKQYYAMGIARHSETLEELVVYQALYGDYALWTRPRAMFEQEVEIDGQLTPRFMFIQPMFAAAAQLRK